MKLLAKIIKAGWARIGEPRNPYPDEIYAREAEEAAEIPEEQEPRGDIIEFPAEPEAGYEFDAEEESGGGQEDAGDIEPEDESAQEPEPETGPGAEDYQAAYDELVQAAQDEVAAMLEDARKEALTIIRESESHANTVREQAWEEGFGQAYEQAKRECEEMLEKARAEIETTLAKLPVERERMIDDLEAQMLDVSLDVAEKILRTELDRDDAAYLSMLRGAMERMPAEENVSIRLSTGEFERFFNCREIKIKNARGGVSARLIADPSLNRYDAVIESPGGVVDAGADAQIKQMRKNMGRDDTLENGY